MNKTKAIREEYYAKHGFIHNKPSLMTPHYIKWLEDEITKVRIQEINKKKLISDKLDVLLNKAERNVSKGNPYNEEVYWGDETSKELMDKLKQRINDNEEEYIRIRKRWGDSLNINKRDDYQNNPIAEAMNKFNSYPEKLLKKLVEKFGDFIHNIFYQ